MRLRAAVQAWQLGGILLYPAVNGILTLSFSLSPPHTHTHTRFPYCNPNFKSRSKPKTVFEVVRKQRKHTHTRDSNKRHTDTEA